MIKKFKIFEYNHSDIDPYNEENWDIPTFNIGDIVKCISPFKNLQLNKKYRVYNIWDSNLFVGVEDIETGEKLGAFTIPRFVKSDVNESHDDIDPYGEENWNDDPKFKKGDIVKCIIPNNSLRLNTDYEILDCYMIDEVWYIDVISGNKKASGCYEYRFVKSDVNESHDDIDPYGEENWDEVGLLPIGTKIKIVPKWQIERAIYNRYIDNICEIDGYLQNYYRIKTIHSKFYIPIEFAEKIEESINENSKINTFFDRDTDFVIKVDNKDEYTKLMQYLELIRYRWADGSPTSHADYYKVDFCARIVPSRKEIKTASFEYYVRSGLDIYPFKMIFNGNIKKIENPDIDPYGEEDWGYEYEKN